MDDTSRELIALLGTRLGSLMEDTSIIALTLTATAPEKLNSMIDEIVSATNQMSALASALQAMKE